MGDDTDADERSDNREGQIRAKHKSSNDESDALLKSCVSLLFNFRLLLTLCPDIFAQTAVEESTYIFRQLMHTTLHSPFITRAKRLIIAQHPISHLTAERDYVPSYVSSALSCKGEKHRHSGFRNIAGWRAAILSFTILSKKISIERWQVCFGCNQ